MNLPNCITIGRILSVPLVLWLLISAEYEMAFYVFIAAGISDAADGFIAKRFNAATKLGAYLDPLADKLLLVSIYAGLGILQVLPVGLVLLVVSRDVMIVGAVMLSWMLERPVRMAPLLISKVNTLAQILLAGAVLAALAFEMPIDMLKQTGGIMVAALTIVSGGVYVRGWICHMTGIESSPLAFDRRAERQKWL